ncbi:uncharacterized protein LOC125812750 [Solanum verrucosum]|uniref:uncharacterized protein LOC125812750 n=1 Tax=Solanum verrucosum TaxID=315347 RepID=UPI0020D0E302|nr:uncharacterized protein LOC125812750 [Solanum verrucosum]
MFDPEEETSIAIAWISFLALYPNFFGKEAIFLLASANQRGSKEEDRGIVEKWVAIKYDYVPKYCKTYMLQGHNENECFIIHPELYPKEEKESNAEKLTGDKKEELERRSKGKENMVEHKREIKQGENNNLKEQSRMKFEEGDKYHNRGGRREQVWHPRKHLVKDHNVQTHNMYEAFGENKEKEEGEISVIKEVEEGKISEEERRVADQYESQSGGGIDRGKIEEENKEKRDCDEKNEEETKDSQERQEHDIMGENQSGEELNEGDHLIKEKESNEIGTSSSTNNSPEVSQREKSQQQFKGLRGLNEGVKSGKSPDLEGELPPKIHTIKQQEKQHQQDTEEEGNMDANIDNIDRSGDLSPKADRKIKGKRQKRIQA